MTREDVERRFVELIDTAKGPAAARLAACTGAHALIRDLDPRATSFPEQLEKLSRLLEAPMERTHPSEAVIVALLEQAKAHYCGGFHRVQELVTSDVFDDLVEQAEHLLDRGYHLPAGALAGAVLEDALRKLCAKHGVTWQGDSGVSKLATELYKAGHLTKPQHSQIETWGKLRNQIDHGDFSKPDDVDTQDVRRMVDGVRDFVAKFLG